MSQNKKKNQKGAIQDQGPTARRQPQKPLVKATKQELAYRIPDCVGHYFSASVNPFDTPAGACVPADLFPLPSSKIRTFVRARMALGTQGIGFAGVNFTGANDIGYLQTTTATTAGFASGGFDTFTNLQNINCTMLPYPAADFTSGKVLWRPVAQGLRVKYVGQLMDRNGVCIGYEDPDHQEWRTKSFNDLNSNPYTEVQRVGSDEWDMQICSSGPVQPRELSFSNDTYLAGNGHSYLGIAVSGVAGDVYEVECYQHIEYIGQRVVNKTKSHADAQMFGKVVESLKEASADKPLQPKHAPTIWERFKNLVRENLPALVETGIGVVGSVITKKPNDLLITGGSKLFENALPALTTGPKSSDNRRQTRAQKLVVA